MDGITPTYFPATFEPTAALLKALLMHGARDLFALDSGGNYAKENHLPNFGKTL